jgi:hypothetical protein
MADEFYWPDWRGDPGSTHQRWEFGTNANPTPPTVYENPYGIPEASLTVSTATRYWATWQGRQGVWKFEDFMYLDIPNTQIPNPTKLVWIQFTYYSDGGNTPVIWSDPPEALPFEVIYGPTLVGGSTYWWHTALLLTIEPNPSFEQITIEPMDCTLYIDEVVVDTLCFPEPAAALLLALPMVVIRRRR